MSAPLRNFGARKIVQRQAHAPILPLPAHQTGNNKPFSLKKTRRNWKPNVHKMDLPVSVLGGAGTINENLNNLSASKFVKGPQLKGLKLAARDKKTIDKAGGVEGVLLSMPANKLTPYGRLLRTELFRELHSIKAQVDAARKAADAAPVEGEIKFIEGQGEAAERR